MANNNHFSNTDPLWEAIRPQVEALSLTTGSCVFVVVREEGYPFLSPNLEMLGFDIPEAGYVADHNYLKERIHSKDRAVFDDFLDKLFDYLISVPDEQRNEYKYIFEFRMLNRNEEWVRVISQHQILDSFGPDRALLLGTVDLSPDRSTEAGVCFTLLNYKSGEIVPFTAREAVEGGLTRREIEILGLIDRGMYSKGISERLSISIHTVNRHRQNILEKMNADNSREAIHYARGMGLLG